MEKSPDAQAHSGLPVVSITGKDVEKTVKKLSKNPDNIGPKDLDILCFGLSISKYSKDCAKLLSQDTISFRYSDFFEHKHVGALLAGMEKNEIAVACAKTIFNVALTNITRPGTFEESDALVMASKMADRATGGFLVHSLAGLLKKDPQKFATSAVLEAAIAQISQMHDDVNSEYGVSGLILDYFTKNRPGAFTEKCVDGLIAGIGLGKESDRLCSFTLFNLANMEDEKDASERLFTQKHLDLIFGAYKDGMEDFYGAQLIRSLSLNRPELFTKEHLSIIKEFETKFENVRDTMGWIQKYLKDRNPAIFE